MFFQDDTGDRTCPLCCHYPSLLSGNNVFKLCFNASMFFVVNVPSKIWVGKILKSECIQNLNALFSYNVVVVNEVVQDVCECQNLHFRNCRTALPFFLSRDPFFWPFGSVGKTVLCLHFPEAVSWAMTRPCRHGHLQCAVQL